MLDMQVLKSKIEEIYEDKKNGDGWVAWSDLCLWLTQYEFSQKTTEPPSQLNGAREGYYWAYNHDVKYWMVVRFTIDRWGQDCYFETGVQGEISPNFYNQWLGPLPLPKG